jgi:hypothetical protein
METVYVVVLEYEDNWNGDSQREVRCTDTREKAIKILQDMVKQEEQDSWLAEEDTDELVHYYKDEDYFEAKSEDYTTILYVKEVRVE